MYAVTLLEGAVVVAMLRWSDRPGCREPQASVRRRGKRQGPGCGVLQPSPLAEWGGRMALTCASLLQPRELKESNRKVLMGLPVLSSAPTDMNGLARPSPTPRLPRAAETRQAWRKAPGAVECGAHAAKPPLHCHVVQAEHGSHPSLTRPEERSPTHPARPHSTRRELAALTAPCAR